MVTTTKVASALSVVLLLATGGTIYADEPLPSGLQKAIENEVGLAMVRAAYKGLFAKCGITDDIERALFYSGVIDTLPSRNADLVVICVIKPGVPGSTRDREIKGDNGQARLRYKCVEAKIDAAVAIVSCYSVKDGKLVVDEKTLHYDSKMPWGLSRERFARIKKQLEE